MRPENAEASGVFAYDDVIVVKLPDTPPVESTATQ
jgi:hypothetical protein